MGEIKAGRCFITQYFDSESFKVGKISADGYPYVHRFGVGWDFSYSIHFQELFLNYNDALFNQRFPLATRIN